MGLDQITLMRIGLQTVQHFEVAQPLTAAWDPFKFFQALYPVLNGIIRLNIEIQFASIVNQVIVTFSRDSCSILFFEFITTEL